MSRAMVTWREASRRGDLRSADFTPLPSASPKTILMAKSEIRTIDVQHKPENRVCQRTDACETDFAISSP
jgi:hypothetical protein